MINFIKEIKIENFKSIRHCELHGCKRINLFIGSTNVGKSNILEALSIFSIPYLRENSSKKLSHLMRIENETELFYNGNTNSDALVSTNVCKCKMAYNPKDGLQILIDFHTDSFPSFKVIDKLTVSGLSNHPYFALPIKKYSFRRNALCEKSHAKYLIPPFGPNLLSIIENYEDLKREVSCLFEEYRLKIAFDKSSQTIKVIQDNLYGICLIPYDSIADSLQRIIFFRAAIFSNSNSVLLFDGPEAHLFPPYITHITQEMIFKNDNQYFVATHSPFILNDLLENAKEELAIFMLNYNDHQTKVRQLSEDDLHELFQDGVDLFTNSEGFI